MRYTFQCIDKGLRRTMGYMELDTANYTLKFKLLNSAERRGNPFLKKLMIFILRYLFDHYKIFYSGGDKKTRGESYRRHKYLLENLDDFIKKCRRCRKKIEGRATAAEFCKECKKEIEKQNTNSPGHKKSQKKWFRKHGRKFYKDNKELLKGRSKDYYEENKEEMKAKRRERYKLTKR